ncbi:hypothetical protein C2869_08845 [Saccharobesus litoralis]|uniref:CEP76/DRC7 peptidase-like domain-containing protein n=1 Tax=Saccharobesus litoralis TaxID=2172099 RepID=A0A2S0VQN9_9ALTE|nr:transglutaminase-like domain-containing protein [Saccharobesus litoralis]AWB66528.1 hypothetical protein C2869_08845 [Saccharobesus litoralis]
MKDRIFDLLGLAFIICVVYLGQYFDAKRQQQNAPVVTPLPKKTSLSPLVYSEPKGLDIIAFTDYRPLNELAPMLARTRDSLLVYSQTRQSKKVVFTITAPGTDYHHHFVHSYLLGYQPFSVDNVMLPLYTLAQRKSYQLDEKQYGGLKEIWQTSRQAYELSRGDCEDHALILADWLITMGEDARVVIGDHDGEGHAWVVLFKDNKQYLLEATRKRGLSRNKAYPLTSQFPLYHPNYMFNRDYFWENTGSKYTTQYAGLNWQKQSQFHYFEPKL